MLRVIIKIRFWSGSLKKKKKEEKPLKASTNYNSGNGVLGLYENNHSSVKRYHSYTAIITVLLYLLRHIYYLAMFAGIWDGPKLSIYY